MKPLITLFLPLCNLPTFKLPGLDNVRIQASKFSGYDVIEHSAHNIARMK